MHVATIIEDIMITNKEKHTCAHGVPACVAIASYIYAAMLCMRSTAYIMCKKQINKAAMCSLLGFACVCERCPLCFPI